MNDFDLSATTPEHISQRAREIRETIDKETALEFLEEGRRLFPRSALLYIDIGYIYKNSFEDQKAKDYFGIAFILEPKNIQNAMTYGALLVRTGDLDEGERVFVSLFDESNEDVRLLTALGNVCQIRGYYDMAGACFGKAANGVSRDRIAQKRYNEIKGMPSFDEKNIGEYWQSFLSRARNIRIDIDNRLREATLILEGGK